MTNAALPFILFSLCRTDPGCQSHASLTVASSISLWRSVVRRRFACQSTAAESAVGYFFYVIVHVNSLSPCEMCTYAECSNEMTRSRMQTARILQEDEEAGAFGGLAMGLTALGMAILLPLAARLL